jgi:hypothetical protein
VQLSREQFDWLVAGLPWQRLSAPQLLAIMLKNFNMRMFVLGHSTTGNAGISLSRMDPVESSSSVA